MVDLPIAAAAAAAVTMDAMERLLRVTQIDAYSI